MWSSFNENPIPYDLRKEIKVFLLPVKSFRLGLNSTHFRGNIPWNNLPSSIKNNQIINEFKVKLKIWEIFTVDVMCVVETFLYFLTS